MRVCEAVELYVDRRHAEGFAFVNEGGRLRAFGRWVHDSELQHLETEQITSFLKAPGINDISARARHGLISRFIEFWQARGEMPELTMPSRPRYVRQIFTPHIYSVREIRRLVKATQSPLQGARRTIPPETVRTLVLFLYGTGSTLKSCIAMRPVDVNLELGMATLTNRRGHGSRTIPINADLVRILLRYNKWKARHGIDSLRYFARLDGEGLVISTVGSHFRKLLEIANCTRRDGFSCRPRLFDFRATFAVHRITAWIRDGEDLGRMLPALAAYMGQIDLTTTERFLAQSPERFRKELEKLSPGRGEDWSKDTDLLAFLQTLESVCSSLRPAKPSTPPTQKAH